MRTLHVGRSAPAATRGSARALVIALGVAMAPTGAAAWDPGDGRPTSSMAGIPMPTKDVLVPKKDGGKGDGFDGELEKRPIGLFETPRAVEFLDDNYDVIKAMIQVIAQAAMEAAEVDRASATVASVYFTEMGEAAADVSMGHRVDWGAKGKAAAETIVAAAIGELAGGPIKDYLKDLLKDPGKKADLIKKVSDAIVNGMVSGGIKTGTGLATGKSPKAETVPVAVANALFDAFIGKDPKWDPFKKGLELVVTGKIKLAALDGYIPKGLPGGNSNGMPGKAPGGSQHSSGSGNAGSGSGGNGSGPGNDTGGNHDHGGDGNDNTDKNADNTSDDVPVELTQYDEDGSVVRVVMTYPEGNPSDDSSNNGSGTGPQGMKDAIANGKNGIGVGQGASGGFSNGDYDALKDVSLMTPQFEWGADWGKLGKHGSHGDDGPDAKGNPNPVGHGFNPGNDVAIDAGTSILRYINLKGIASGAPTGTNSSGFTGGKGGHGPVNDDDKMPNPFDDNSPVGPNARAAATVAGTLTRGATIDAHTDTRANVNVHAGGDRGNGAIGTVEIRNISIGR